MYKKLEILFSIFIKTLAFISFSILCLILIFILKESLGLVHKVPFWSLISGVEWQPLELKPQVSVIPFLAATIYVSLLAVIFAVPMGVAFAIFISIIVPESIHKILKAFVNMLAGIPSVIYGFIGLSVVVKFFEGHLNFSTGESIFAGGIVLAVMILPYIVSTCDETMSKVYGKYSIYSKSLGISKWYMINNLIIPSCGRSILVSVILSTGRAMGETMAVMMVIGNSPIMPKLFGKGETIPALIALEMGSAQIGSIHYHALFASGFVLMVLLLIINTIFYSISKRIIV
ncbi:phosphate ABC transporter permease subunit PstC [Clostridium sp. A1-XYC3]|uniref:Phosphate transport system permease protein n=1 Tax=Clostridium tanneri TaxID=3037988 RepID=A0ABU4JR00_9CLOT|nr:phosphate ABC transporter permease subunit PstC [Clostridium sp. A1-XYC3]MDW8800562.1 phosphate ABC transporter permease subunit PstC [Clostridium sp. A1-XYC3]